MTTVESDLNSNTDFSPSYPQHNGTSFTFIFHSFYGVKYIQKAGEPKVGREDYKSNHSSKQGTQATQNTKNTTAGFISMDWVQWQSVTSDFYHVFEGFSFRIWKINYPFCSPRESIYHYLKAQHRWQPSKTSNQLSHLLVSLDLVTCIYQTKAEHYREQHNKPPYTQTYDLEKQYFLLVREALHFTAIKAGKLSPIRCSTITFTLAAGRLAALLECQKGTVWAEAGIFLHGCTRWHCATKIISAYRRLKIEAILQKNCWQ